MDDRTKKRSDKLTKQSFALLDRIRQRKEKQKEMVMPAQENYIQDLYLKVFGKCSPHFNKMETSNDILTYVRSKQKEGRDRQIEVEFLRKECGELKQQVSRLKESQDDVARVKTLNQQIAIMETKVAGLNQQIKVLRISKAESDQITRKVRQECESMKASNKELEDLVEQLSAQLQNLASQQNLPEEPSSMVRSISGEVDSLKFQLQQTKSQNQQLTKEKAELMEKMFRVERELQTKSQELMNIETPFKSKLEALNSDIRMLAEKNNQLKLSLAEKENQTQKAPDFSQELQVAKRDLHKVVEQLTTLKLEKQKNQSQQADELLKYQNETFSYLEMIRELNKNGQLREGELSKQIKDLQNQIKHLKQEEKVFSQQNKKLSEQKQNMIQKHRAQLEKKEQLFQKLFNTKNELDKAVKSKESEISELKKLVSTLELKLADSAGSSENILPEFAPESKDKDAEISELKLKILTLEKKNESLQEWKPCPPIEDSMYLDSPDKIKNQYSEKINKHMQTIKELNQELTEAYHSIEQKDKRIKQLEKGKEKGKEKKELPKSPEKERGRSVKRLAGMFGF